MGPCLLNTLAVQARTGTDVVPHTVLSLWLSAGKVPQPVVATMLYAAPHTHSYMSIVHTNLEPLKLARQFTVMDPEHALFHAIDPDKIFNTSGDVAQRPARDVAVTDMLSGPRLAPLCLPAILRSLLRLSVRPQSAPPCLTTPARMLTHTPTCLVLTCLLGAPSKLP
jgi:hypothetical protein